MALSTDRTNRKERPIARGVLDYFPQAMAEVANVSFVGNQQHNPGEKMHWSKGKSNDHADCIARHLIERGTVDTDGLRHTAKIAWRALALLQTEIEDEIDGAASYVAHGGGEDTDANQCAPLKVDLFEWYKPSDVNGRRLRDYTTLCQTLGCPPHVAAHIAGGTTYAPTGNSARENPYVYIAGPMRGKPEFNFPTFDAARDYWLKNGYNVISPADIDRAAKDTNEKTGQKVDQATYAFRDFTALHFIKSIENPCSGPNKLFLLPGWEKSVGATAERAIAQWIGLTVVGV